MIKATYSIGSKIYPPMTINLLNGPDHTTNQTEVAMWFIAREYGVIVSSVNIIKIEEVR